MMKLNSISLNIPGTKRCVHENGLTAVVSETDCVYLYEGGKRREPQRMFAFNPKSEKAVYIDEKGKQECYTDELQQTRKAKQIHAKGLQLLAAAHCSLPQQEGESLRKWLQSLWNRPPIDHKELKSGHRLVISIYSPFKEYGILAVDCAMLGDCLKHNRKLDSFTFLLQKDPDLDYGIHVSVKGRHMRLNPWSPPITEDIDRDISVVELTREEVKWLRGFFLPHPAQRYLNVHKAMVEADEAEEARREERGKEIMRSASRAGGKTDPYGGTVAI